MSRTITGAMVTASQAEVYRPVLLAELHFSSIIYLNSSDRTITAFGHDFVGVGTLGEISDAREGGDLQADGLSLKLSGVPPDLISVALTEHYQGQPARLYLALLDANYAPIADPVLGFSGRIDTMDIEVGATATITLTAESRLVDWERPRTRYYSDADQQQAFPGDLGLQFVQAMVERTITWGRG